MAVAPLGATFFGGVAVVIGLAGAAVLAAADVERVQGIPVSLEAPDFVRAITQHNFVPVRIRADGLVELGEVPHRATATDTLDFPGLRARLAATFAQNSNVRVMATVDPYGSYGAVVRVIDAALAAGIRSITVLPLPSDRYDWQDREVKPGVILMPPPTRLENERWVRLQLARARKTAALLETARARGAIRADAWRVVAVLRDGREILLDFASLDEAKAYADEVATEAEYQEPRAIVLNAGFEVVHEGWPRSAI